MIYVISDKELSVSINTFGAEIVSAVYKGAERVWQNENGKWAGHSPVLFPVCGNSAVEISGKDYKMPFHGFAKRSEFSVVSVDDKSVTLLFAYNEKTLEVYPFKFEFYVTYRVENNAIKVEYLVRNVGEKDMPFAVGRHDSFNLAAPVENYRLRFDEKERFLSHRHDDNGKLINFYDDFGEGIIFDLPDNQLVGGHTIIFDCIESRKITLEDTDGNSVAEVSVSDTHNLLLWRPDDCAMICLELWSALPDGEEQIDIDKNEKYFRLEKGGSKKIDYKIRYF